MRRRTATRSTVRLLVAAAMATAATLVGLPGVAQAVDPCLGSWSPVLHSATVNQGLESYRPLVRGKTTLVRLYLTAPQCAPLNSVELVSAELVARDGSTELARVSTTPSRLGEVYPPLDPFVVGPPVDSPASPLFRLPDFAKTSSRSGAFDASFTATVTYRYQSIPGQYTSGTTTYTSVAGAPITATVGATPNPLRVLLVPMGDASATFASQFPESRNGGTPIAGQYADTVAQKAMLTLGRLMPVADGVGDLTSRTAGLRYRLNDAAMIDLGSGRDGLGLMSGGVFCGTSENYAKPRVAGGPTLSSQLSDHLTAWNKENSAAKADRVVGVVWQTISRGTANGCVEGMATLGGTQAYVRLFADNTVTSTSPATANPSMTGSLLGMEISHALGGVRAADPRVGPGRHSNNTKADPANSRRAYHTTLARWLVEPRSVMFYTGRSNGYESPASGAPSAWHDDVTLLEKEDWQLAQCRLTAGMTGCPTDTSVGDVGVGATANAFALSGQTDGTRSGTDLTTSFATDQELTPADPSSSYRLVQRSSNGTVLSDQGIPVRFDVSAHASSDSHLHPPPALGAGAVQSVLRADPAAVRFEVWKGAPGSACATSPSCLYTRTPGTAPTLALAPATGTVGGLRAFTSDPGVETAAAVSPDGRHVAFVRSGQIFLQQRSQTTNAPVGSRSRALQGTHPAWSPDGRSLAYATASGDIRVVSVDRLADPPTFGADGIVYDHLLQTPPQLRSTAATHPGFSPSGTELVAQIDGGIWRLVNSRGSANPVICDLATLQATTTCRPLATDGDDAAPTWGAARDGSGRTFVAYSRGSSVWTLNPAATSTGYDRRLRLSGATQPAAGGGAVAVQRADGIWLADPTQVDAAGLWTSVTRLTTGPDQDPALSADGGALALDRGTAAERDVHVGTLGRSEGTVSFSVVATGDPAELRSQVYVSCAGAFEPVLVALRPTASSAGPPATATFTAAYDDARACPGGTIYAQATNGWSVSALTPVRTIPWAPVVPPPTPAIGSPSPGSTFGQYESVLAAGSSVDPAAGTDGPSSSDTWALTGPSGSGFSSTPVGTGARLQLDPPMPGGWTPGAWTLTRTVTNESGVSASVSTSYTVLPDRAHIGVDTVTVAFSPQTLFVPSNGQSVTLTVSPKGRSLKEVDPATVRIVRAGGTVTAIGLEGGHKGWIANSDGSYTAKFSRQALTCALAAGGGIGGYLPVVIEGTGPDLRFTGYDPLYPRTTRSDDSVACS